MKKLIIGVGLLLLLGAAGCILSGTFTTDVDFTAAFNNGFEMDSVDITNVDHADNIDRIERIDVEAVIRNDKAVADTINVYISSNFSYTTKSAVKSATDVYPLILGYVTKAGTPPTTDTLTITEARAILQIPGANWDQIKTIVKGGVFAVYFTNTGSSGASGAITEGTLYITFTAKL